MENNQIRLSAASLIIAGVLFVLYPWIRPYSDETTLLGAHAFASDKWLISHMLGIIAFIMLSFGMSGISCSLRQTKGKLLAYCGFVSGWLGIGLTLPFYGAEVFGLREIGKLAAVEQSISIYNLADAVRNGPGLIIIICGLLLLAAGSILTSIGIWKSKVMPVWTGIPLATGLMLYLPQYMASPSLRIAHGFLVAAGCLCIALYMLRHQRNRRT